MERRARGRGPGREPRVESERGAALIFALLAMTILMALGAALVVITSTETIVAGNFRDSRQAFYAAEAAAELAVAELRTRPNWIEFVEGTERSGFVDGEPGGLRALPMDAPVDLTSIVNIANCNTPAPCGGVPRWQLFACGPLRDVAPPGASDSPFYIVALISGGQTGIGGAPRHDQGAGVRAEGRIPGPRSHRLPHGCWRSDRLRSVFA